MLALAGAVQPDAQAQVGAAAVPGEFIVKFAAGTTEAQHEQATRALGGELAERIRELNMAVVRFNVPKGVDTDRTAALAKALEGNIVVDYAEPNWLVTKAQEPVGPEPAAAPGDVAAAQAGTRRWLPLAQGLPIVLPDDPGTAEQWAWNTIGAYRGWGFGTGAQQVMIAVIDSGVEPTHPDLAGKLVPGYDFVDNDGVAQDGDGHGTHVAGTAAGITNNAIGIAGACPSCSILPIRVLDDNGRGGISEVVAGIRYAADRGAKVINLSLSGPPSKAEEDAVNYAWSKGAVLACAAGNEGTSSTRNAYPAASPNCIAVGATDRADAKASFSNYGTWVDIAAPGADIVSTYIGGSYESLNGTSMATPHVAGAAGLLAAKGLSNAQIRAQLEATADKIAGTGVYWSAGRLNIQSAMR